MEKNLLDLVKLDNKIIKQAWYQSLEKIGIVIPIWPISPEQMPQWIINRAKKYNLHIDNDSARLLSEYVSGNLAAALQAIEKIYLSHPEKRVDESLIKKILVDESHYTIFDFVENLISGNQAATLQILKNLKEEGIEPVLILWGITRELRLLADFAQQLKQGMSFEVLWQKQRIFSRRQTAMRHFLSKNSAEQCWQHLTHAIEIDRIIKGAACGNVWNALQLLCLRIQGP
jgi:DNA polymerase-3 subunit delta